MPVSQCAPPSEGTSTVHCSSINTQGSKNKMKRGERKIIKKQKKKTKKLQNKIKLNIKKEKKYPYYKILNQQLTKRPHVGIHFFFFYLGFNPFALYSLALVADCHH